MRIYLYSALRVMAFQAGDLRSGDFFRPRGTKGTRQKTADSVQRTTYRKDRKISRRLPKLTGGF